MRTLTEYLYRLNQVQPVPTQTSLTARIIHGVLCWGLVLLVAAIDWLAGPQASFSLFYLIAVTLAVIWFGGFHGVLVAFGSAGARLAGDFLTLGEAAEPAWIWWNTGAGLLVHLGVVWILNSHLLLHRQLEERVSERTQAWRKALEALQRIERELQEVGSRERAAMGRELHDELCQHLVGSALATKVLGERIKVIDRSAANDAQKIVGLLEEAIAKTRDMARGLILAGIKPADLGPELAELASQYNRNGTTCRFLQQGAPVIKDDATAAQLFRIGQEAVRNAFRHGDPTRVDIILSGDSRTLQLIVEDDGRGLPPPDERGPGMGLRIIAHRAAVVGGELQVTSAKNSGTRICCTVRAPGHPPL